MLKFMNQGQTYGKRKNFFETRHSLLSPFFLFLLPSQCSDIVKNICILTGVPGVARDEKLQKQIFKITWRDKGWIG
jgi:hypothetical protein